MEMVKHEMDDLPWFGRSRGGKTLLPPLVVFFFLLKYAIGRMAEGDRFLGLQAPSLAAKRRNMMVDENPSIMI